MQTGGDLSLTERASEAKGRCEIWGCGILTLKLETTFLREINLWVATNYRVFQISFSVLGDFNGGGESEMQINYMELLLRKLICFSRVKSEGLHVFSRQWVLAPKILWKKK